MHKGVVNNVNEWGEGGAQYDLILNYEAGEFVDVRKFAFAPRTILFYVQWLTRISYKIVHEQKQQC